MSAENFVELADNVVYNKDASCCMIRIPKKVATIKLCGGALTFDIDDTMQ